MKTVNLPFKNNGQYANEPHGSQGGLKDTKAAVDHQPYGCGHLPQRRIIRSEIQALNAELIGAAVSFLTDSTSSCRGKGLGRTASKPASWICQGVPEMPITGMELL